MRYRLKSHEQEVAELYRLGKSTVEIARQFKVSPPSVNACLQKMRIPRRTGKDAHSLKDYCLRGHELTGENLYVSPRGIRGCRACRNQLTLESKERCPSKKITPGKAAEYRSRWCRNNPGYDRERKTGMTHEQFLEKQQAQKNLCVICGCFMITPNADHNHETGQVRDLLCHSCNHGLGKFKDSEAILAAALKYLKRWNRAKIK